MNYDNEIHSAEVKVRYAEVPERGEKISIVLGTKNKKIYIDNIFYSLFVYLFAAVFMVCCLYTYLR